MDIEKLLLRRYRPGQANPGPVLLCIMDGVGWGRRDDGDAVYLANTPTMDSLLEQYQWCLLAAHGEAVGLPSDKDMGNSEVGHNALGAGRVFAQGAKLVGTALREGTVFRTALWHRILERPTLHLLGLLSDGNVHSHVNHLHALIEAAATGGARRLRVHILCDGRDVPERSALSFVDPLEAMLSSKRARGLDYRIASGGGRMHITMDRYEADWSMVQRGWDCHVHGSGRTFISAREAILTLYKENPTVTDQFLPHFVIVHEAGPMAGRPVGTMKDGDAIVLFNFRGDRALEISRAFENRMLPTDFRRGSPDGAAAPSLLYAGIMEYDGDAHIPRLFLVPPPSIHRTVSDYFAANGISSFAISETQKFGHVTYFFNGNRSEPRDPLLETWMEIPSDPGDFQLAPAMKAPEITRETCKAMLSGRYSQLRLNYANGDMVGHTGELQATIQAVEAVDAGLADLLSCVEQTGGLMLLTADHGNADQMFQVDKKTGRYSLDSAGSRIIRTSHSLNPVPFVLVDPLGRFAMNSTVEKPGIGNIAATLLLAGGFTPPEDYLPALIEPA